MVADEFINCNAKLTDLNSKVINSKTKIPLGEIDTATEEFLIEVKRNLKNEGEFKSLAKQLEKYLDPKAENYINADGKKVVVVIENLGNHSLENPILKELSEKGVNFVISKKNIIKLFK